MKIKPLKKVLNLLKVNKKALNEMFIVHCVRFLQDLDTFYTAAILHFLIRIAVILSSIYFYLYFNPSKANVPTTQKPDS